MIDTKRAINSVWFFPAVILIWGLLSIFFAEKLPANDGLGWDGMKYAGLTRELLHSPIIDNYYVLRIFPPMLVHMFLSLFSIDFSSAHIIRGFETINLVSIVLATYVLKLILVELKITPLNQLLAFSLFLLSHAVSKYLFYYPVLTDAPAICLGALTLYFYLKDETLNLVLTLFIATFTLPLLLFLGVILIAFPRQTIVPEPLPKPLSLLLSLGSAGFMAGLIGYWYFIRKIELDLPFTLQVDPDLIYISVVVVLVPFLFFPDLLSNRQYLQLSFWKQTVKPFRWLLAIAVFFGMQALAAYLNYEGKKSGYLSTYHTLTSMAVGGIVRPGIVLTSLFSYYGIVGVLLILFWRRFSQRVLEFGPGLATATFLSFYMFGTSSQTRVVNSLFVWLIVLMVYAINEYKFSRVFYLVVPAFNLLISRVWLPVRYGNSPINADGTVGFPNQKFLMNLGPWVSEYVWYWQGVALICTTLIFVCLLFRSKVDGNNLILEKEYL